MEFMKWGVGNSGDVEFGRKKMWSSGDMDFVIEAFWMVCLGVEVKCSSAYMNFESSGVQKKGTLRHVQFLRCGVWKFERWGVQKFGSLQVQEMWSSGVILISGSSAEHDNK